MGGIGIWYFVDCQGQEEKEALALCRKHLSKEAAKDVFVLTYDRMRRYEGAWHMEKRLVFPSYIVVDSEDGALLAEEMGNKGKGMMPVGEEAEHFLRFLYGDCHHLKMSQGVIRDGIPQVTAGPLKGFEQRICRIDRHRRLAELSIPMGQPQQEKQMAGNITAGLEITEKRMQPVSRKG